MQQIFDADQPGTFSLKPPVCLLFVAFPIALPATYGPRISPWSHDIQQVLRGAKESRQDVYLLPLNKRIIEIVKVRKDLQDHQAQPLT